MQTMVACDFIDLSDGQWHVVPQNAVHIVFEGVTTGPVDIQTSHSKGLPLAHIVCTLNSNNNKDHHVVLPQNQEFVLQNVRAVVTETDTVRVYFNRIKL